MEGSRVNWQLIQKQEIRLGRSQSLRVSTAGLPVTGLDSREA